MTASEELSLRYYEICCHLLQRWNLATQNNREDMNMACSQSGATYDELRSILKHLRAKYMAGYHVAQKQGKFVGDFFGYYTSTKRPRGRPPAVPGQERAPAAPRAPAQPRQAATGAGDVSNEVAAGATGRRVRVPSARARKANMPYEAPMASTHSRSSSSSSKGGRKGNAGNQNQPPAKRVREGGNSSSVMAAAAAGAAGARPQQQQMQQQHPQYNGYYQYHHYHNHGHGAESWAAYDARQYGDSRQYASHHSEAGHYEYGRSEGHDTCQQQLPQAGKTDNSMQHLVAAAGKEGGEGQPTHLSAAAVRSVSPVLDDHGLLLLGLKARPAPFLRRESSTSSSSGPPAAAASMMMNASMQESVASTTDMLNSSMGATTIEGASSVCSSSSQLPSYSQGSNHSMLDASYSSINSTLSAAMPPAGGQVISPMETEEEQEAVVPAPAAACSAKPSSSNSSSSKSGPGPDHAAADLFVSMMHTIGGSSNGARPPQTTATA